MAVSSESSGLKRRLSPWPNSTEAQSIHSTLTCEGSISTLDVKITSPSFCSHIPYLVSVGFRLTFVFLSSAVVSSNSSPSLKEISVFLKVLSDLMVITSPFLLIVMFGLATPAIFLVANPTPVNKTGYDEIFIFTQWLSLIRWGKKTKQPSMLNSLLLFELFINSQLQRFFCNISITWCGYRPSCVGWHKEIFCSVIVTIVKVVFRRLRQDFNAS